VKEEEEKQTSIEYLLDIIEDLLNDKYPYDLSILNQISINAKAKYQNEKMRTKAKGPAFPLISHEGYIINAGLTKREYFATMALQGLLANNNKEYAYCVISAVEFADDLIEELSKKRKHETVQCSNDGD
jgi:hypothetical protein